jgi:hypothetical protein
MNAARIKLTGKSKLRTARRTDLALALAMLSKAVRIYHARQCLALVPALPRVIGNARSPRRDA